ncbi:MAG TPA: anthranilate synthase component 1 [Rhodanobacteraceae bacterium]|nr:anthranilate synthase component 1 [Rhodanobacteraceae bacterium]
MNDFSEFGMTRVDSNARPLPARASSTAAGSVRVAEHRLEFAPHALGLFRQLTSAGRRRHVVLLESAEPGRRQTQRSLLVTSAALAIVCRGAEVAIDALNANGRMLLPFLGQRLDRFEQRTECGRLHLRIGPAARHGSDRERLLRDSVLSVLRVLASELQAVDCAPADAVFLAGVFGYDLAGQYEDLPDAVGGNDFPDYAFVLADTLIDIDHLGRHTRILASVFGDADCADRLRAARVRVARIAAMAGAAPVATAEPCFTPVAIDAAVDRTDEEFAADVVAMQRLIVAGDVFQIVPSRTFSLPCRDPLAAYAALAELNPSPYLFHFNGAGFTLFGASPESAIKVDGASRRVEISPIAGTRPRGRAADGRIDADLDSRYEAELRLDEKENAEHMMLVDLARNDIARIAEPGTRAVTELLRVVRYSHVMHLASRVGGTLRAGLDALHAVQACLAMGTLTGAPKVRAMQLLRCHEPGRRGHYGGAIGYLRGDGSLDSAIVIRAALVRHGIADVRAGAGVVHDSVPALEADETRRKAEAVLRAIAFANAQAGKATTREAASGAPAEVADVA